MAIATATGHSTKVKMHVGPKLMRSHPLEPDKSGPDDDVMSPVAGHQGSEF